MWINYHKPEILKYIQTLIDQYATNKLYENYLIPEALERLNEIKIMESFEPKPTIYHPNYNSNEDENNEYSVWPKDEPNPPLKWKDPTPWLEDETPTSPAQNLNVQQQIVDALRRQNSENRRKYERFKHRLRIRL